MVTRDETWSQELWDNRCSENTEKTFNIIIRTTHRSNPENTRGNSFCMGQDFGQYNQSYQLCLMPPTIRQDKPIVGLPNFDKYDGTLYTLQYMYDKNKEHDPYNHKIGLMVALKMVSLELIEDKGEKHNFVCPPNSAICRVGGVSNPDGIKGLKFYCQDINGKQVKALRYKQ